MGKISPVSIKYSILAKFYAEGVVEKPDVIGAVFGQTEGLLGEELELRELQKNGKIGRIEVEINAKESKSEGTITIPTSLDKTETTIVAAAIETIDRVGPCSAKVEILKIEDVRGGKRDYVLERAKQLLEKLSSESPDYKEMHTTVTSGARASRVTEQGDEKLPAGPDMDNPELIVVEGRADVLNLLTYNFKNVIGMNGASLPKQITELGKTKELTLFVDGDRGGDLIIKDALENAKIAYVAKAPPGREVEELTGKEINAGLRAKMKVEEYLEFLKKQKGEEDEKSGSRPRFSDRESRGENRDGGRGSFRGSGRDRYSRGRGYRNSYREDRNERYDNRESPRENSEQSMEDAGPVGEASEEDRTKLQKISSSIEGTNAACLLDNKLEVVKKVSARELTMALRRRRVYAIVFDGLVTSNILKAAEEAGCKRFVAKNFSAIEPTPMELLSL